MVLGLHTSIEHGDIVATVGAAGTRASALADSGIDSTFESSGAFIELAVMTDPRAMGLNTPEQLLGSGLVASEDVAGSVPGELDKDGDGVDGHGGRGWTPKTQLVPSPLLLRRSVGKEPTENLEVPPKTSLPACPGGTRLHWVLAERPTE